MVKKNCCVVGDVDPVLVVKRIMKIGKVGGIVSIGPSKSEDPKPSCCNDCQLVDIGFA